jgi:hypothetical protein
MLPNAAPTPEEAARGEIPERFARALAVAYSPDGNHAVVLLGTNEEPYLYPYQVVCSLGKSGWVEGTSSNGPGWSSTSSEGEPNVGVATDWDEAPPEATAALVSFEGQEHEVPVQEGYFLFAALNVPDDIEGRRLPSFVRWIT